MKSLPVFLRTPARAVIAVGVIVLVVEFLVMLLIEGVFNPIGIGKIPNIFLTLIDPLLLIAFISPALYILIFRPMRKQQLDELRRNEQLASLIDAIPDAVVLKDGEGRWLNINEPARQMFKLHNLPWEGKTGKELADMNPALRAMHERCVASDEKAWQAGRLLVGEESVVGADGQCAIIEARKMPMFNEGGQRKGLAIIGRDITEHKAAQARIERLTNLYRALSEVNQAIVRMDDESTLLPLVCQVAVDLGGTRLAWIGRLNEASGLIEPVVIYGSGAEYLNGVVASSKQNVQEGRGPSAIAFRENRNVIVNNIQTREMAKPWHEAALRYDLRSCGSFPISRAGKPFAVFTVYHSQPDAFDAEMIRLLDEMSHDISFALDSFDREKERRQAQEALLHSERHFRAYFERAMVGMAATSPEKGWLEANEALCTMLGYSREELMRLTWAELTHPDDLAANEILFNRVLRGDIDEYAMDKRFLRKGGSFVYVHIGVRALRRADGSVDYIVALVEDISERKHREAEIIASEERLSTLIDTIPDAVFLKDGEGRWLITNEPGKQMFQLHALPWQGKTEMELAALHPAFRATHEGCLASDENAWQAGHLLVGEEILTDEEGQCTIIETRKVPLFSKEGQRKGLVVIGRDVTERNNAEVAMLNLNRDLSESRQCLRGLAAQNEEMLERERKHIAREVHDELGQVLTALRMDISLIDMRFGSLDPAVTDKVMDMRKLVDRAIQGVRNVAMNLRPPALDMGLVPAIHWLSNEFSRNTTIECVLNVRQGHIDLDEARAVVVFRIVQESLTNVTRYAEASLVKITIGHRGNELWVEVRDNGRGFDVDAVTKGKSFGLLGMRERALALGGQVDITSVLGQGTVIGLMIPIELASAEEKQ